MKKLFSLLAFLVLAFAPYIQASQFKLADELQMRHSSSSSSSEESAKQQLLNHHRKCDKCKITLADLTAFDQVVEANRNILFTKINLVDPRHFFDVSDVSSTGELVIRRDGTFDIVYFAVATGNVQLQINGHVVRGTPGFPTGFSITVPDVPLKKGDIVTLHNVSGTEIGVTAAGLTVSLIGSGEAFGASTGGRFGAVGPATTVFNFVGSTTVPATENIPFQEVNSVINPAGAFTLNADNSITVNPAGAGTYKISFVVVGAVPAPGVQLGATLFKNFSTIVVDSQCADEGNPFGAAVGSATVTLTATDTLILGNTSTGIIPPGIPGPALMDINCVQPPLPAVSLYLELQ